MSSTPTFAEQQVARIEQVLQRNPGVQSFTIGNTSTTYDDLIRQYEYWMRRVAIEKGSIKRVRRIYLGNW